MARDSHPRAAHHKAKVTAGKSPRQTGPETRPPVDATDVSAAEDRPDGEIREHMVAEAAYYRALKRGFDGGDPNEDWYAAEREIDGRYGVSR